MHSCGCKVMRFVKRSKGHAFLWVKITYILFASYFMTVSVYPFSLHLSLTTSELCRPINTFVFYSVCLKSHFSLASLLSSYSPFSSLFVCPFSPYSPIISFHFRPLLLFSSSSLDYSLSFLSPFPSSPFLPVHNFAFWILITAISKVPFWMFMDGKGWGGGTAMDVEASTGGVSGGERWLGWKSNGG